MLETEMKADWEPGGLLLEAWSELHAVMVQTLPTDDHFIMRRVIAAYGLLEAARLKAIQGFDGLDIRAQAIATAREHAASVTDLEQKAELLESLRTAERAALDQPRPFQALVNDPTFIRRP